MKCRRDERCILAAPHTGRCFGGLPRDCDNCARKINAGRLCHWCATSFASGFAAGLKEAARLVNAKALDAKVGCGHVQAFAAEASAALLSLPVAPPAPEGEKTSAVESPTTEEK